MAKPVCSSSMSPGSTTTSSAAMISSSVVEVDAAPVVAEVVREVDEHAAALHAVERHVLEAEVAARSSGGRRRRRRRRRLRPDEVDAGAVAVVVDGLLDAVAVGVELGARRGRASPTASSTAATASRRRRPTRRRTWGRRSRASRSCGRCRRSPALPSMSSVGASTGGWRRWFRAVPPGKSSGRLRQKLMPASTSRTPCEHLLGREQVDAAELVVVAPVAPRRAGRALLSTACRHWSVSWASPVRTRCNVPTGWSSLADVVRVAGTNHVSRADRRRSGIA